MQVTYSLDVEFDLEEIARYIAEDNPRCAVTFLRELRAEMASIGLTPMVYRLRPEVGEDARLAAFGRYVIFFRIDGDVVRIERVVHGNRLLPGLYP